MSPGYRIEYRWILMGPLLGYFSGLVLVSGAGLVCPPLLLLTIALGAVVGGPIGACVGLIACLPLVFLVGPHLSVVTAERRALALGAALPPLVLPTDPLAQLTTWAGLGPVPTSGWTGLYVYGGTAVLGGITAVRTARIDMPRTDVS